MLGNYLKIAFRNLLKKKSYSLINILGLSIGIACCVLILLFVKQETSYDTFHENAERIYRVHRIHSGSSGERITQAASNYALASMLEENLSQVQRAVRLARLNEKVGHDDVVFQETQFFYTDPDIFKLFDLEMLAGDPETALAEPLSVVLTKRTAVKYFGTQNPLGKTLEIDDEHMFTVTGVVSEFPVNSHFHFDFLASLESTRRWMPDVMYEHWGNLWVWTYVLTNHGSDIEGLETGMNQVIASSGPPELAQFGVDFHLFPLEQIHLHSNTTTEIEPGTSAVFVYVFAAVAIMILIIACFNFINMATARSAWRAKEVGMRKTLGAHRGNLILQFIGESMLITAISLGIALLLAEMAVPYLNQYLDTRINSGFINSPELILSILGILLVVGLLAGSYPAFVLSSFEPIKVLKGQVSAKSGGLDGSVRKGLVLFQFTISIVLITGTLILFEQLQYVKNRDLGFDEQQVVVVNLNNADSRQKIDLVKQRFIQDPDVSAIGAASDRLPASLNSWRARPQGTSPDAEELLKVMAVDADFFKLMDIPIMEGRNFSKDRGTDFGEAVILNEAAVHHYGLEDPVGKQIYFETIDATKQIVGVVRNFHHRSLHQEIVPISFHLYPSWYSTLYLKVNSADISASIADLRGEWESLFPGWPFQYQFLDQAFEEQYRSDENLGKLIGIFSFLAIFIGCLGLFGLASFTTERRFKEIGVRKVLGATVPDILSLISKDYLVMVLVSLGLSIPVSYWVMGQWLNNFTYRISIGPAFFLLAGAIALVIAAVTVSSQTIKAATMNPVDTLRSE